MKDRKFKYHILVIGCGGTGGYFLKEFARYLYGQNLSDVNISDITICDGDIVEKSNISRQPYIEDDIGEKKAIALSMALEENFGVRFTCYPKYLEKVDELNKWFEGCDLSETSSYGDIHIPVIIGCVDNHGCRLLCETFFKESYNCIYFDSANEFTSGEVTFSYKLNGKQLSKLRSEIFPDIKQGDTRNVTEMSCEELNIHSPQHIATNMRAGNILLSAVCKLIKDNAIMPGMVFFDVDSMSEEFIKKPYSGGKVE